jgi:hypothetical protein
MKLSPGSAKKGADSKVTELILFVIGHMRFDINSSS